MSENLNRLYTAVAASLIVGVGSTLLIRPSRSAGGPVPVQVAGIASTSDVDNPARQPFAQRLDITINGAYGKQTLTVPAGKRLVITYVSVEAAVKPGAHILLNLATTVNGSEVESNLPAFDQGVVLNNEIYNCSAPMDVTADPGSTVTFDGLESDATVSGYVNDRLLKETALPLPDSGCD